MRFPYMLISIIISFSSHLSALKRKSMRAIKEKIAQLLLPYILYLF